MAIEIRKLTAEEFLKLPPSNTPHELIHGEERMSPSPTGNHQRVSGRLFRLLSRVIPSGEVLYAQIDVLLDDQNIVQPDLLWVAAHSACVWVEDKYLKGGPDLTIEIFSPGTARRDKKDKFRLYEQFGVREYWMIDPDERWLEIWQARDGQFGLVDVFGPDDAFRRCSARSTSARFLANSPPLDRSERPTVSPFNGFGEQCAPRYTFHPPFLFLTHILLGD
jgi:Uma2 family endonuclease